MIVKRTYGIYSVSYRFVRDMYVLSEQGCEDWWGSGHGVAAEIDRREKLKESIEWND